MVIGQVQHISVEESYAQGYNQRYGKDGFMMLIPAPQDLVTGKPNQSAIATVHIEKYDWSWKRECADGDLQSAKQYYEFVYGNVPPNVEIDHYEGDNVVIHLYEISNNATSTWDWYTINPYTCEGTDFLGNEVRLYEAFGSTG